MRDLTKNPNAKLSFKHWGQKVSVKVDHSDLDIEEFHNLCRTLAYAAGYGDANIKEYFQEY